MTTTRIAGLRALATRMSGFGRGGDASESQCGGGLASPLVRWWELALYGVLLVTASVMRLWDLGSRAVHHDESLHAFYSWNLYNGSGYVHNPMMHGPFQFEANAALFYVFGDSDYTSRLLYAFLGIALVGMPFLFRARLGRYGALFASGLLAFSPTMLYFSRFSRNDILMSVWTLGLVICVWRYLDEGKNRYLYASAALLALAFATKESAYMVTALLGLFLVALLVSRSMALVRHNVVYGETSPPDAVWRWVHGAWAALREGASLQAESRIAGLIILLITLTLPQWAAAAGLLQKTPFLSGTNIVLTRPDSMPPIGAPAGGGEAVAFLSSLLYWECRFTREQSGGGRSGGGAR